MARTHLCCKTVYYGVLVLAITLLGQTGESCAQDIRKANVTYKLIAAEAGSYGYDVFADGKRLIHQATIPGQPGTSGFKSRSDAEKVAKLVVRKLKNGEIPPAITEEELRKLKVID